jgi:hypothetical protein
MERVNGIFGMWRVAMWGGAAALLALPAIAMAFFPTAGVDWSGSDFVLMGVMLFIACTAVEVGAHMADNFPYLGGVIFAVATGFVTVWANLAVGMIGDEGNPANLAFLGVLALAVVQLRWRSYEVAALRVVGVRRRDLRRAIVTEYVALLGMAVIGGGLAAVGSLLMVLPSLDIGTIGEFDPPVDFGLRWLVLAGVLGVVLVVVLAIAFWISRRTVKQGTPSTLRQADAR